VASGFYQGAGVMRCFVDPPAIFLYWDSTGFALWYKRLEKARFKWPSKINTATLSLDEQQLYWLLNGYDVIGHQSIFFQQAS
jgi:transposase